MGMSKYTHCLPAHLHGLSAPHARHPGEPWPFVQGQGSKLPPQPPHQASGTFGFTNMLESPHFGQDTSMVVVSGVAV